MTEARDTVWVLGDQLTLASSAFHGGTPKNTTVLLVESLSRAAARPYHKQKLVLLWSAMRHFAEELKQKGYEVDYHELAPNMREALERHLRKYRPSRIRLMESAEYGASEKIAAMVTRSGIDCDHVPNNLFISDREPFEKRYRGNKSVRLEGFYRTMRRTTGLLMEGNEPEGGQWNYDKDNREVPDEDHRFPSIPKFEPDGMTNRVMRQVQRRFPDHFGELEGFAWPVTRRDADRFFEDFLEHRLDLFGPYEDAMVGGEAALYHSLVSPLLNLGLLHPLDVCRRAEARYRSGKARLNSVEGFVRQVIGWRELVYQLYHWQMPGYTESNALDADVPLPDFYWTGETSMRCVAEAVGQLRRNGINHHIQRLMVTGNFALIAGIDPRSVNEWYWLAYADAFEWVVSPNVLGLALYADGGLLATKPYAASANYIHKMSDYCGSCPYDRSQADGEDSCPFNALYWDFGSLDNISLYHLFEDESRSWAEANGGSVVELHAYAVPPNMGEPALREDLMHGLEVFYPELAGARVLEERFLIRRDCPAFAPGSHANRPGVATPHEGVALAGDFVRLPIPSALMERAVASGFLAANHLLAPHGVRPEPVRSIPRRGLLGRRTRRHTQVSVVP